MKVVHAILAVIVVITVLAACAVAAWLHGENFPPKPWVIEVLRTTDARGMTYESLHSANGEPEVQGTALRWTDEKGRRWIFTEGALAHEFDEPEAADK
jgi:hypothetical protein